MKRLICVFLIVYMIFTTGGFSVLADSVSDVVEEAEEEVETGMMLVNGMTPDGFIVGADGAWVQ